MKIFKSLYRWMSAGMAVALLFSAVSLFAQVPQPQIFFSDLESGPNVGGQGGNGAFVTIWGKGFGATQGTSSVTVGGGAAASLSGLVGHQDHLSAWHWLSDGKYCGECCGRKEQAVVCPLPYAPAISFLSLPPVVTLTQAASPLPGKPL